MKRITILLLLCLTSSIFSKDFIDSTITPSDTTFSKEDKTENTTSINLTQINNESSIDGDYNSIQFEEACCISYRVPSTLLAIPIGLINSAQFYSSNRSLVPVVPIVAIHMAIGYFIGKAGLSDNNDNHIYFGLNSSNMSGVDNNFALGGNFGISTGFKLSDEWSLGIDFDYIHRRIANDDKSATKSEFVSGSHRDSDGEDYDGYDYVYQDEILITQGVFYMPITVGYVYNLSSKQFIKVQLGYGTSLIPFASVNTDNATLTKVSREGYPIDSYSMEQQEKGINSTLKFNVDYSIDRHMIKATLFTDVHNLHGYLEDISTFSLQYGWKFH